MGTPDDTSTTVDLPDDVTDRTLSTLADPARRTVVAELEAHGRATVDELAALLADRDGGERAAKIRLVHCHLPKLAEAGTVAYDRDEGEVRLASETSEFTAVLASGGD